MRVRWTAASALLLFVALPAHAAEVDFREDVYPLLKERCFACHAGRDAEAGYRLDDRRELLGQTDGRVAVKPGDAAGSKLIRLVTSRGEERMPPEGAGRPLTKVEVDVLRRWIDEGLPWNETLLPPVVQQTDHWAFQPVRRPDVPRVTQSSGPVRNPVDAFVARKHTELSLSPAPPASRRVLIRRLSLDLLGFPPTPEQVAAFVDDPRPDAYERLVDRLLASPHYGVRWGRHWLDVARWSETEGFESNHPRPFAWRYRDWVVDAFNEDLPYDEFVRMQVAGDELTPYTDENLIATGFLAAARLSSNEEDKWLQRNTVNVDIANATANAFLGVSFGCAQCHNHKFDALTQRDYYRLQAYFTRGMPANIRLRSPELVRAYERERPPEYEATRRLKQAIFEKARQRMIAGQRAKMSPETLAAVDTPADERTVEQELVARRADLKFQATPNGIKKHIPDQDRKLYAELERKLDRIEKEVVPPQTFAFYSPVTSPHDLDVLPMLGFYPPPFDVEYFQRHRPYLMIRGDVHGIGPRLRPGWPAVFDTVFDPEIPEERARTRFGLADWLTDPRNPLTARVWVNRLWHWHFGHGLVATPGDFGVKGAPPTHPELLDWLAGELVRSGWSTKHVQRLIVTSAAYRRASTFNGENAEIDPDNACLWHWRPRRLEAEALRDTLLAVTGELDPRLGGKSVPLDRAGTATRRALYLYQKRGLPPEMQGLFDGPSEAADSCARRYTSTTPLQSLYLLNDEFVRDRAQTLAAKLTDETSDRAGQIEDAFVRVLGRRPDDTERAAAQRFFEATDGADDAKLVSFCQALLNLNELAYVE